ncbi:MAG TPA: alpha/beta hydrolase [Smithella sp.]|nr:alpha/beta hydrolase [Smithella sp.]
MIKHHRIDSINIACWVNTGDFDARKNNLVLIHGSGGNHGIWAHQYGRLHKKYNIAAVNLPGHGPSEGNGERHIQNYSDWMKKILPALGLTKPVLVGHSLGAAIALQFAVDHPEKIAGIVCLGGGIKMPVNPFMLEFLKTNPSEIPAEIVDMMCKFSLAKENREKYSEPLRKSIALSRVDVLYGDLLACNELDLSHDAARISVPALIVCGAEDKMTPPDLSQALAQQIGGAKLVIIEGAGHTVMLEKPSAFNQCLDQFAESVFPASNPLKN